MKEFAAATLYIVTLLLKKQTIKDYYKGWRVYERTKCFPAVIKRSQLNQFSWVVSQIPGLNIGNCFCLMKNNNAFSLQLPRKIICNLQCNYLSFYLAYCFSVFQTADWFLKFSKLGCFTWIMYCTTKTNRYDFSGLIFQHLSSCNDVTECLLVVCVGSVLTSVELALTTRNDRQTSNFKQARVRPV